MSSLERDVLLEAAVTAHRRRDPEGRLVPPPEWWDLPAEDLDRLQRLQLAAREVERLLDPAGQSATVKAVLAAMA